MATLKLASGVLAIPVLSLNLALVAAELGGTPAAMGVTKPWAWGCRSIGRGIAS